MKILRFDRARWLIAVAAAGALAAAGPSAGTVVVEPSSTDWIISQTPNPGYYGNILHGVSAGTQLPV